MIEAQKMQHPVDDEQGQLSLQSQWARTSLPHRLRIGDDNLAQGLGLLGWQYEGHAIGLWWWLSFPLPVALVKGGK